MDDSTLTGNFFDFVTPLLTDLYESPYLNFGYWDPGQTRINAAQEELVKIFGNFSRLAPKHRILDIGFGTGEQDIYLFNHFGPLKIVGINISKSQVETAKAKLAPNPQLKDSIEFLLGDALKIAETGQTGFDRILALESAQLLEDKSLFFENVSGALAPEGKFCLAEPILNHEAAFEKEGVLAELAQDPLLAESLKIPDRTMLVQKIRRLLQTEKSRSERERNYQFLSQEYPGRLAEHGLEWEETRDISENVLPIFPLLIGKIAGILNTKDLPSVNKDAYLTFLAMFVIRRHTFSAGTAGYFLIRAVKAG